MPDKRDILIRLLGEETVSRMAGKAGDGLDKLGDSLDATEKDAKDLDRQIAEVEGSLKALAVAFTRTQDEVDRVDLTKAIRRQQAELRKLTKARDLLPDFGEAGVEAAERFGIQFVQRVGPLVAKAPLGPAGAALGVAMAAFFTPILSAGVAGAVLGGVGAGGVIGGIALASKDSRVQAAGKGLGEAVMGDLEESAGRFVQPTIQGIGIIRSAWDDVSDDVDGVLAAASRFVVPLARGIADAGRRLAPAFREAAEAAEPIIDEFGEGIPRVADALGDVLEDFTDDADEGASAIRFLFMVVEDGVRVVGGAVHAFAQMYRGVLNVADAGVTVQETLLGWNPLFKGTIAEGRRKVDELKAALDTAGTEGADAGTKIEGGLRKVDSSAADAATEVETLAEMIDRLTGEAIDSERATIALEEAIDRAAEAAKDGADKGINPNTEAGRRNREALLGIAEAAKRAHDATLTQTGSQAQATEATERGRKKFLEAADAMGVAEDEAITLANKLFGIPSVKPTVDLDTEAAKRKARDIQARIDRIHGKTVDIIVQPKVGQGSDLGVGGIPMSHGGPVMGPGPRGVDSVRTVLAPGEWVLTTQDVDAAGGPAGVRRLLAALRGGQPSSPATTGTATISQAMSPVQVVEGDTHVYVEIDGQQLEGRITRVVRDRDRQLKRQAMAGAGRR